MEAITWGDSYSVGVEEIDRQHRDFFKLFHRLQILCGREGYKELAARHVLEVAKYAEYHFVSEENLMMIVKYPGLEEQQAEHRKLLADLQEMLNDFEAAKIKIEPLVSFFQTWFLNHTTLMDRMLGNYMHERAGRRSA
jgi:hemerythrin